MSIEVKIPSMGESITGGLLASWHVKDGDTVKRDQVIYELETDKITAEGVAEADGKIAIKIAEGTEASIGDIVATIDPTASESETVAPTDEEKPAAPETGTSKETHQSPAVRRIAVETNINPAEVEGSGKAGRVTKGDMLKAQADQENATTESVSTNAPAPKSDTSSSERTTRKKMSPLRQRIAQRLVSAQREAAILSTFNEVDMTAVMNLRKKHQENFTKQHGIKLGFMSFFIKAVVNALKEVPSVNSQVDGDSIVQNHFFDVGVAVSTEKGLVVPVLRDCDLLSFAEIEQGLIDYSTKAREGKITIPDLEGGVFTLSNGGVFGSLLSTPIINPPQAGILGMHSIQQRPIAVDGEVVIRPMMYLALSYDHRVIDGKEAVTFLVKVKESIEDPARLLIGI
jgi:2-oxoglutarate dehydrogenase E2 component (dihydrolipoamide succinyltransferase)